MTVGGTAAPLYYAGAGQINAQIPFELAANTWLQVVSKTANAIAVPENITLDVARPGTQYNDNGSLVYNINGLKIPYPVDQALAINPFNMVNFFANYTIKNASWLRGSKIGLAVNNLADSHNIAGVTPRWRRRPCPSSERRRSAELAAWAQRHGYSHGGLRPPPLSRERFRNIHPTGSEGGRSSPFRHGLT